MNPEDSFRSLLDLQLSEATLTLYMGVATGPKKTLRFEQTQITDEPERILRDIILGLQGEWAKRISEDGLHLADYDGQDAAAVNEIEYLTVEAHDDIRTALAPLDNPVSLPTFHGDSKSVSALKLLAIRAEWPDDRSLISITYYTGSRRLAKRGMFAMLFSEGTFNSVAEDVYEIPNRVDALLWEGRVFINNSRQFSLAFAFHEKLMRLGQESLKMIEQAVPFSDFKTFRDRCGGSQRKLAKLSQAVAFLNGKTFDLGKAKLEMDRLGIPVEFINDSDGKLQIDTANSDEWAVIKLLCGDNVQGLLDGVDYEATRKRPYIRKGATP